MRDFVLALPPRAEAPAFVRSLVDHARRGAPLAGNAVLISAEATERVSADFAEELVRVVLVEGGAAELVFTHAHSQLIERVMAAAAAAGVSERLFFDAAR